MYLKTGITSVERNFTQLFFSDLYEWEEACKDAVSNYNRMKSSMNILTATMVGKDMKLIK